MENVGLITYRDAYIVLDEAKASQSELQACLDVVGHEIAHQWFGNLVTMRWWEGAWLNEAFASFMELKATDARKPDWKRWLAFANLEVPWAMGTDQLATTRPIEFEVNSPAEVDEMFDSITYGKGSAVLRMIEQFIGEEEFRTGVGNYLRKHEYANTVTGDLWEGLDGASDWPVGEIMDTWVNQKGFPQIDVRVASGRDPFESAALSRHSRRDRHDDLGRPHPAAWLRRREDSSRPRSSSTRTKPWSRSMARSTSWSPTPVVMGSIEPVTPKSFHRPPRPPRQLLATSSGYSLVSDTWAMVRSAQVPASAFLDLVGRFVDETEHAIWSVIIGGLRALEHHALEEQTRPAFETFVRDLVGPALDRLAWEGPGDESDLTRKLRGDLIAGLGILGNDARHRRKGTRRSPATSSRAASSIPRFAPPLSRSSRITVGPRSTRRCGPRITEPTPQPRRSATSARWPESRWRSWPCRPWRRSSTARSGPRTGSGSSPASCPAMPGPPFGKTRGARWDEVLAVMPGMTKRRVVEGLPALSQPELAADVKSFFAEHPIPEAARFLTQNLELLDTNVLLRERETPVVTKYFRDSPTS